MKCGDGLGEGDFFARREEREGQTKRRQRNQEVVRLELANDTIQRLPNAVGTDRLLAGEGEQTQEEVTEMLGSRRGEQRTRRARFAVLSRREGARRPCHPERRAANGGRHLQVSDPAKADGVRRRSIDL